MQSTVRSATSQEQDQNIQFLTECLTENGLFESLDSQSETSGRMPILAGHSLVQQARRMKQRPFSLAGVRLAESNRFDVNLDSQAITCNRPPVFGDPLHLPAADRPALSAAADLKMAAALCNAPTVRDFRSRLISAVESTERTGEWPALDEEIEKVPTPAEPVKNWSMATSMSRIPTQTAKANKAAADAESLRELLEEAREREAQRITARMKAFRPAPKPEQPEGLVKIIDSVKTIYDNIKVQYQFLSQCYARAQSRRRAQFVNVR